MKTFASALVVLLVTCSVSSAQTTPDLQIKISPSIVTRFGGEFPSGASYSSGPVTIGKSTGVTLSNAAACDAWTISSDGSLHDAARVAWRMEITPVRVVRHAVRFRLRWIRSSGTPPQLDPVTTESARAAATKLEGGDTELNLGPGESWPIDTVPVPPKVTMADGRPCGSTVSIRVSVERYPDAPSEGRLIGAEMWLIERMADGSEEQRSQPLALRGLPGRPFDFYFDNIVDGSATLDIHGVLIARQLGEETFVTVETRSRWTPEPRPIKGPQRFLNSEVRVKPGETVDIRLPPLGDDAGPFAKRALSIRIRARQIR